MAYGSLRTTVKFLTVRRNEIQNRIQDIMLEKQDKMRQGSNLAKDYRDAKNSIRSNYDSDTVQYQQAMDEVQEEFEYNSAIISSWENELDMESQNLQTESQAINQQIESFESMKKDNIKEDHSYMRGSK